MTPEDKQINNYYWNRLTLIQQEATKKVCPHCGNGSLHAVPDGENEKELYLWCDTCDLSMDSSGGYIS